jgi:tRNA(Arg) A34 adenosine deaminase TadA
MTATTPATDIFMLMALWMQYYPRLSEPKTAYAVRKTACVIVDARQRVIAINVGGESHAIVRAILSACCDLNGLFSNNQGCDVYVSRFPCPMGVKFCVQAGIKRIFYFPARDWEMDWRLECERHQGIPEADSPKRFSFSLNKVYTRT